MVRKELKNFLRCVINKPCTVFSGSSPHNRSAHHFSYFCPPLPLSTLDTIFEAM